jgi:hypothetical protein
MDDTTERKVRDLKLKILQTEKELSGTQHHTGVAAMLRAGHPGQLAKTAERERKRLETKLEDLRARLAAVEAPAAAPEAQEKAAPAKAKAAPKTPKKTGGK